MLAVILLAFGLLGFYFSIKFFMNLHSDIKAITLATKQMGEKIGHKDGDPVAHFVVLRQIEAELREFRQDMEKHVSEAGSHYEDVKRLNDDEIWTRCPLDKCPNMGRFTSVLQSLVEKFENFDKKAQESRAATGNSLEGINAQMQQVGKEIGDTFKVLLQTMTDIMVGRK